MLGFPAGLLGLGSNTVQYLNISRVNRQVYLFTNHVLIFQGSSSEKSKRLPGGGWFLSLRMGRLGWVNYPLLFYVPIITRKSGTTYHTTDLHICEDKQQILESCTDLFPISCNLMQIVCAVAKWASYTILYKNQFLFLHCLAYNWKHLKEEFNYFNHTV